MDYIIKFTNLFSINSAYYIFPILLFIILLYTFINTTSIFFQILLLICILLSFSVLLAMFNLDFFSGFLLTAELPIILVILLFFFSKASLVFNNLYTSSIKNVRFIWFIVFFLLVCIKYTNFSLINYYNFSIISVFNNFFRNDFFIYYSVYYTLYPSFVIFFGFLIFIVSYLVILIYFFKLSFLKTNFKNNKSISFLRKQNLLKQSVYKNKVSFYKK